MLHLRRHRGVALELDAVGPCAQRPSIDLHQQVGPYLGQARQVDLAPPAGGDGHALAGEAHHQAVHAVVVEQFVLSIPAVQVGPVAAADGCRAAPGSCWPPV